MPHSNGSVNGSGRNYQIPPHLIGEIARRLKGEPNKALSNKIDLRFGTNGSLSVNVQKGILYDHEEKIGGGILDFIERETGAKDGARWEKLEELTGFKPEPKPNGKAKPNRKASARYNYVDAAGILRYQVVRYDEPKTFRQRRPDPDRPGKWLWNRDGVEPLPYRLPQILKAIERGDIIGVVEGEKDADNLARLGIEATTNHGGANKWWPQLTPYFEGANVVLMGDNHQTGLDHINTVGAALTGTAPRIRHLDIPRLWPECPPKGDVSDWIGAGATYETILAAIEEAPDWRSPLAPSTDSNPHDGRPYPNGHAAHHERAKEPLPDIPSEAALADALVNGHGEQLRYVASWGRWMRWDGAVWREEKTHLVRYLTKILCQEVAGKADTRELRSIASARTVNGVQVLAQADRRVAATVEQWDADPWLLNTPAGTIDLRTCELSPHSPDDHATKITGTAPADNAECRRWLEFLHRVFADDIDLIAYIQRVLGYGLTGITKEHAMWFAYGPGGNGKSVLIETVAGIMGDYHTTAPIETFTASMGDRHPTELADLVGARLVTATETEEGRSWAEARVKKLTGGDRVKARFMRQNFFEFVPQFKLVIAGNHQPALRTVDDAIKRRFNMIPFEVTIPAAERDPDLTEKLKAEWSQILRWMLVGCLTWQQQGLQPPAAVTEATGRYLEAQDAMGAWLAECCEVKPSFRGSASKLYASWKSYAERMGELPGSSKTFGPLLERRGFRRVRGNQGNFYVGLQVINEEPPPPWVDR